MKEKDKLRNALYFRQLQGLKPKQEKIDETIEFILDEIETEIKIGSRLTYKVFKFYDLDYKTTQTICEILKIEYGFNARATLFGSSINGCELVIDWGE